MQCSHPDITSFYLFITMVPIAIGILMAGSPHPTGFHTGGVGNRDSPPPPPPPQEFENINITYSEINSEAKSQKKGRNTPNPALC